MAANTDLSTQIRTLRQMLRANADIQTVLDHAHRLALPHWYLGAGAIAQTVWNLQTGRQASAGIQDLDLVYFDASDLSAASEEGRSQEARKLFSSIPLKLDVKNQARVHLWYEQRFGYRIEPYA